MAGSPQSVEIRDTERARHQFAEREHLGLPRQRGRFGAYVRNQRIEALEPVVDWRMVVSNQFSKHRLVTRDDPVAQSITLCYICRCGDRLELVGMPDSATPRSARAVLARASAARSP